MTGRTLLAALFLLTICSAQEHKQHRTMSTAEIFAFHGPIHTQKAITRQLEKDLRVQPKLLIRTSKDWLVFDQAGRITEEGNLDGDGKISSLVRRNYNAEGEESSSVIVDGKQTTEIRLEKSTAADGSVETKTFANDRLVSTVLSKSDASQASDEVTVKDGEGKTISHTRSQKYPAGLTIQSNEKDGRSVIQARRRVDQDGHVIETSMFDESGKLVSIMSFSKGELTSFWQDPDCSCANGAGFHTADGTTGFYRTDRDGVLYKEIQHHIGRQTNHEIDDDDLYDQSGRLTEKITYTYVRDAYGNWIRRTVSVLDLNTNSMVAVQEDTRELTYY
jgi:hypothetical protein